MNIDHDPGAAVLVGSGETTTADEWETYVGRLRGESLSAGWPADDVDADLRAGLGNIVLRDAAGRHCRFDLSGWTYRNGTAFVPGRPDGPVSVQFVVVDALVDIDLTTVSPLVEQAEAELARLDAVAAAAGPYAPPVSPAGPGTFSFAPTHVVPAGGMRSWPAAGAAAPGPSLDPRLAVQVVTEWGSWAEIVCGNGWRAWVDGRQLERVGSNPTGAPTHPAAFAPPTPPTHSSAAPTGSGVWTGPSKATWRVSLGAALVALGTTMPWYDTGGGVESLNAFDVPAKFLADYEQPGDGVKLALVLLVAAAAAFVARHRRGWERWTAVLGSAVGAACIAFVLQVQRQLSAFEDLGGDVPGLTDVIGLGVVASIAGAGLLVWGGRAR